MMWKHLEIPLDKEVKKWQMDYETQISPVVGYDGTQILWNAVPIAIGNADRYDFRRCFRAGLTPLKFPFILISTLKTVPMAIRNDPNIYQEK